MRRLLLPEEMGDDAGACAWARATPTTNDYTCTPARLRGCARRRFARAFSRRAGGKGDGEGSEDEGGSEDDDSEGEDDDDEDDDEEEDDDEDEEEDADAGVEGRGEEGGDAVERELARALGQGQGYAPRSAQPAGGRRRGGKGAAWGQGDMWGGGGRRAPRVPETPETLVMRLQLLTKVRARFLEVLVVWPACGACSEWEAGRATVNACPHTLLEVHSPRRAFSGSWAAGVRRVAEGEREGGQHCARSVSRLWQGLCHQITPASTQEGTAGTQGQSHLACVSRPERASRWCFYLSQCTRPPRRRTPACRS